MLPNSELKTDMKRIFLPILLMLMTCATAYAIDWETIKKSGEYYWGEGKGATTKEATERAMADLVSMIATHVSNDFLELTDETNVNGTIDHKNKVLNCIKTYSNATLTNVEKWSVGKEPNLTMRCYMKKTELARIYDGRIAYAREMTNQADECLQKGKVDMALQYYYWAYSLVRSLQHPNEVKDENGRLLMSTLPQKINEILSDISVNIEKREGEYVDLLFNYKGKPVSSLEFTYSDGRSECNGSAKDGRGMIQMAPGYETDVYHINIEYEYKGQSRGDAELESVLGVISKKVFKNAALTVTTKQDDPAKPQPESQEPKNLQATGTQPTNPTIAQQADSTGIHLQPKDSQLADDSQDYADIVLKVIEAIKDRNSFEAMKYFTTDGKEIFRKLIGYGTGRIVGTPRLKMFKSSDGRVVSRGLQMSFSFNRGTKKTFVEDVVFTFNPEKKIESMAFGLGQVAENDILCKEAQGWTNERREMLMEFLENYKTAYCLQRLDYLETIFADDAVIIVGNVAKRATQQVRNDLTKRISIGGQQIINYNRYDKETYLKHLADVFRRNEFINIRFSNNKIQWLEKYNDEDLFAIQIGQEYNSSTYGDKGYLFLLVNMTNPDEPLIKVRTWQPNEVDMKKLYTIGDFYRE